MWENRTGRTSAPRMEREKDKGEKEGEKVFKLFIHQCERTRFHQSAFWSSLKHCINISEKTADMLCPFRTDSMALIYPDYCMCAFRFVFDKKQRPKSMENHSSYIKKGNRNE